MRLRPCFLLCSLQSFPPQVRPASTACEKPLREQGCTQPWFAMLHIMGLHSNENPPRDNQLLLLYRLP